VQIEAIRKAVVSKFMVLTGGPGTGKTTTTLAIIKVFQKLVPQSSLPHQPEERQSVCLKLPVWRQRPYTVCWNTVLRTDIKKNDDNPLECDVLIIDETSMIDIILMYNLLKAVSNNTVVILVGDVDQLPSVGAGNVLKDIIESGMVTAFDDNADFSASLLSFLGTAYL